jgi:hypothetical protein
MAKAKGMKGNAGSVPRKVAKPKGAKKCNY